MEKLKGLLFDIQGFSVHDGPGCRTGIFFKGCGLRCFWCSNPEGINRFPEIMFYKDRCRKCYQFCLSACPPAISLNKNKDSINIDRNKCKDCGRYKCTDACPHDALKRVGYFTTVEELLKKIQRDRNYWGSSGGITLSGGEPLLQRSFAGEVLKRCHDSYIHTAVETSGHVPWKHFKENLDHLDWIFFDIKHMDPAIHRKGTGVSNELILKNAENLAALKEPRIIFRATIIPGYNDTLENITATARFLKKIGKDEINILPFHRLGASKYGHLGRPYGHNRLKPYAPEKLLRFKKIFKLFDVRCYLKNNTPF